MTAPANLTACENCATELRGEYCHQCGQSVHNPIRHAGHAIEEFFEAFWHLDGRLWRTLRDLMVPGRTAANYLAGHRARYIPPLRLFVVLSVLTFFIGTLAINVGEDMEVIDVQGGTDVQAILDSDTVAEVERERDRLLAEIEQARGEAGNVPGVDPALIAAEVKIRGEAANRIAELREAVTVKPAGTATTRAPAPGTAAGAGRDSPVEDTQAGAPGDDATASGNADAPPSRGELFSMQHEEWAPENSRVKVAWLPQFANDWLTGKLRQALVNVQRMDGRTDLWFKAFMASVPSALFVLVPVFALLLKLAYLFKRRLYLEHLVVALYSHVFLLLALTATFLLSALGHWVTPHVAWLGSAFDLAWVAVLAWMPVYLLLMQKRVYRQGWWMTTVKYLVIGFVYFYLLFFAAGITFVVRLAQA